MFEYSKESITMWSPTRHTVAKPVTSIRHTYSNMSIYMSLSQLKHHGQLDCSFHKAARVTWIVNFVQHKIETVWYEYLLFTRKKQCKVTQMFLQKQTNLACLLLSAIEADSFISPYPGRLLWKRNYLQYFLKNI